MPLRTYDTKADFDSLYDIGAEGAWGHPNTRAEVRMHYNRFVLLPYMRQRAQRLYQVLGWTSQTRLVIVGCGFNWTAEVLETELGMNRVIGLDVSVYIQAAKSQNEDDDIRAAIQAVGLSTSFGDGMTLFSALRGDGGPRAKKAADILNENIRTNASRNRVKQYISGAANFEGLSENVLESLTDAECAQLSGYAHQLTSGRISHFLDCLPNIPNDETWNAKTLEQWKALLPNDTVVENGTFRV